MTFRVKIQDEAAEDLIEIWEDIAAHNSVAADRLLRKLDQRIDSLFDTPERGAARNNLKPGLRMLVEGNYLIFYRVMKGEVQVVRVLHGSRDLTEHFG